MDVIFFTPALQKEILFSCTSCGWVGSETELDFITSFNNNLVCCPVCFNDDVRVFNDK
jgi:hypothetical protein